MRRGCFPGSFDPLTIGHLAIAEAAHKQCGLDQVDLVLSSVALGKDRHHHTLEERVAIIEAAASDRPWLSVAVTDAQLLADIATGYDVLVLGADKWAQLVDPSFYESVTARDQALARLPVVACAARPGFEVPAHAVALRLPPWVAEVSSTAVRGGALHWHAAPDEGGTRQSPE